jgi:hypothetical protein
MATKPRKSESKKKTSPAKGPSLVSTLMGAVMNMSATVTAAGGVLLCLIIARRFT